MANYKTVHQTSKDQIIINKSKFIGHASNVENESEAIEFINRIKKEYKDATHNVYAYIIDINTQRYNDDGEPSGTAGLPILNVLKQENLKNTVIVVTRYFGGVKLGAGGLVRAYTKSAKIAIESSKIVNKVLFSNIIVKFDYTLLGIIEREIKKNKYTITTKEFTDRVTINILCKLDNVDKLKQLLKDITNGKIDIVIGESKYISVLDNEILID